MPERLDADMAVTAVVPANQTAVRFCDLHVVLEDIL